MRKKILSKIDEYKKELYYLIDNNAPYKDILKKSEELDVLITKFHNTTKKVKI